MARIQIMRLPAPADEYPFVLILDDVGTESAHDLVSQLMEGALEAVGARAVLVFPFKVEVV